MRRLDSHRRARELCFMDSYSIYGVHHRPSVPGQSGGGGSRQTDSKLIFRRITADYRYVKNISAAARVYAVFGRICKIVRSVPLKFAVTITRSSYRASFSAIILFDLFLSVLCRSSSDSSVYSVYDCAPLSISTWMEKVSGGAGTARRAWWSLQRPVYLIGCRSLRSLWGFRSHEISVVSAQSASAKQVAQAATLIRCRRIHIVRGSGHYVGVIPTIFRVPRNTREHTHTHRHESPRHERARRAAKLRLIAFCRPPDFSLLARSRHFSRLPSS